MPRSLDLDDDQVQTPITIPFNHFGATSCGQNGTAVCVYYQYNSTAIAELEYDQIESQWNDPSYVSFQFFNPTHF